MPHVCYQLSYTHECSWLITVRVSCLWFRSVRQAAMEQFCLIVTRCVPGQKLLVFFITLLFTVLSVGNFSHLFVHKNPQAISCAICNTLWLVWVAFHLGNAVNQKLSAGCIVCRCDMRFLWSRWGGNYCELHCEPKTTPQDVFWHAVYKAWLIVIKLVHIVLSKFVIVKYKRFQSHLNSVSTLPCET